MSMENAKIVMEIISVLANVATIVAVAVAVMAIKQTSRDNQKQITIGKVEEIYEITNLLYSYYPTLNRLYLILEKYHDEDLYDTNQRKEFYEDYKFMLEQCQKKNMYEELYNKIFRLNVLANSYLQRTLKIEILSYTDLFESLLGFVFHQETFQKKLSYREGYPTHANMHKFIKNLEAEFIKIINIGSEQDISDFMNYQENEFKTKLGLK